MAGVIEKVLHGVIKYNSQERAALLQSLKALRKNPARKPTSIILSCMDARVYPGQITQSAIGSMFVLRNAGNMMPAAPQYQTITGWQPTTGDNPSFNSDTCCSPEIAALDYVCVRSGLKNVIVCGHSDCKAMGALHTLYTNNHDFQPDSPLDLYLRKYGWPSIQKHQQRKRTREAVTFIPNIPAATFEADVDPEDELRDEDVLSQLNTLQQLENIASHHVLKPGLTNREIRLHAFWFDVRSGSVNYFSKNRKRFMEVASENVAEFVKEIEN